MMKDLFKFLIINFFIFSISFADSVKFKQTLSEAEGGDPFSQNNIAHMYQNGIGTQKDIHLAFNWYMKAGEQGQVNAMTSIAAYYLDGEIFNVDFQTAFTIYKNAANLDYKQSAFYKLGKKENIDYESNFKYNQSRAIYGLALMYEKGYGTNIDYKTAKQLLLKADEYGHEVAKIRYDALAGDPERSFFLGDAYRTGSEIEIGLPIDLEDAAFWYKLAEYLGYGDVVSENLEMVLDNIALKDLNNASKRFEAWKASMGFDFDKETLIDVSEHFLSHYGTGFYISKDILVSNSHVLFNENKRCSKILAYDPYESKFEKLEYFDIKFLPKFEDVMIVKGKNQKGDFIKISSQKALPAEDIFVIGYPSARETISFPRVSKGIINSDIGILNNKNQFIFDAFSEGGSSGSPILNSSGELVGVLWGGGQDEFQLSSKKTTSIQKTNEGYGIKSEYLKKFLKHNGISFSLGKNEKVNNKSKVIRSKMENVRFIECYTN